MDRRHARLIPAALAGLALLAGRPAAADEPAWPAVTGTWSVEESAVVIGANEHFPTPGYPGVAPRLLDYRGTLRVAGQRDRRFWGTMEERAGRGEDVIGIFTGEGRRFLMVDEDGVIEGEMSGDGGTMRYCHRHVSPTARVASCGTATRVE